VLFDLQDLGCRIYTFITTLLYMLEEAADARQVRVGAGPAQPGGRPVEGLTCAPAGKALWAQGRCRCATA
jgi:uncharacterized protein YbbC (DUF1343 family)